MSLTETERQRLEDGVVYTAQPVIDSSYTETKWAARGPLLNPKEKPMNLTETAKQHSHYFKPCPYESIDVYRVLNLFNVTDPCIQHAIKKLLVTGGRGAGKDSSQDIKEAIDSLERWKDMRDEEAKTCSTYTP